MDDENITTELTVLPSKDSNRKELNFIVREDLGSPVYRYHPEHAQGVDPETLELLKKQEDIQEGDILLVSSLTGGFIPMTVEGNHGNFVAKQGMLMACLEFGTDDRECWICVGLINMKGVTRLRFTRSD